MVAPKDSDPAVEAWRLMTSLVFSARPRMFQVAQEFDLHPGQLRALQLLDPGSEVPMSVLAGSMFCDASNVTGIVDRLEARGLIERRPQPPPELAALEPAEQRALRDALRPLEGAPAEAA